MATVQELKDALIAEQANAVELTEKAVDAIGTVLTLSSWVLGVLGGVIALLAVFGYGFIARGAKEAARKLADDKVDAYIKSKDFADMMQASVEAEVKKRMTNKFILANLTEEQDGDEPDPFPSAAEAKKK